MIERAGVLAVQGDVPEHADALRAAFGAVEVEPVRSPADVDACEFLVLPGGESTTISRFIETNDLAGPLRAHVDAGKPLLATCAGLILVSAGVPDDRVSSLDLLDVQIERNGYGGQRESFEAPLAVEGLEEPFPGVFIRAPRITAYEDVEVLARYDGEPVAVRQGAIVGASFHPELTTDPRFHRRAVSGQER